MLVSVPNFWGRHTDNGRRDCRRGWEADEPVLPCQSYAVVSKPTTFELTEAGFVSDLHDVRTEYRQDSTAKATRSPPGACLSCLIITVWVRPFLSFLSVALPRGKWRGAHPRLYSLSMCQSVCQSSHQNACMRQHPSIRCIASPAGSV